MTGNAGEGSPAAALAQRYFPHVDGLRALAVVAVLVYHLHASALPGGFVGVDVFFVISGYVVTSSLAHHRSESLADFLGRFYARRLARLLPALVAVLCVSTLAYALLVPRAWFNRAADTVGQAAFWGLSNWVLDRHAVNYFEPRAEFNPFTHTWSLGVEEQFYLIAPVLLYQLVGARAAGTRRALASVSMAALGAASLAAWIWISVRAGSRAAFYQIPFRFWELGAGVLLYRDTQPGGSSLVRQLLRSPLAATAGALLVGFALFVPQPQSYPWLRSIVAVAGTVLLIGDQATPRADGIRRALAAPPAVWLGLRSYSLYLWHWPIDVMFRWTVGLEPWPTGVVACGLALLAASASYRWIERPIRRSPRLQSLPVTARIAGFALLSLLGWQACALVIEAQPRIGLGQATRQAADWYGNREMLRQVRGPARRCDVKARNVSLAGVADAVTEYLPVDCPKGSAARLIVIGDSHAMAYLPMLEQYGAEEGRPVTVVHPAGCPYIDLMHPFTERTAGQCYRLAREAMQSVLASARPGDVVFLPSLRVPRLISLGGRRRAAGADADGSHPYRWTPEELHGVEMARLDAPQWFVPFMRAGLRVVFEAPPPVFRAHPFSCVDGFNRNNPDCSGGLVERRADQQAYRAPIVDSLADLVRRHPGLRVWDPLPLLCDASACRALVGGRPLYFDGDHISPYGNLVLFDAFSRTMNDAFDVPGDATRR